MPATSSEQENVAEVASVHISVNMGEGGTGTSYELDGLSPESAIGYLMTVSDQIRDEVRRIYDMAQYDREMEDMEIDTFVDCPECGHSFDPFDVEDED